MNANPSPPSTPRPDSTPTGQGGPPQPTTFRSQIMFRNLVAQTAAHRMLRRELDELTAWVIEQGAQGLVITEGEIDVADPASWPRAAYRPAFPDSTRATANCVPTTKGRRLRADPPRLTAAEREQVRIARIGAAGDAEGLLAIIDRLTGGGLPAEDA
jgi:hypothetical protein